RLPRHHEIVKRRQLILGCVGGLLRLVEQAADTHLHIHRPVDGLVVTRPIKEPLVLLGAGGGGVSALLCTMTAVLLPRPCFPRGLLAALAVSPRAQLGHVAGAIEDALIIGISRSELRLHRLGGGFRVARILFSVAQRRKRPMLLAALSSRGRHLFAVFR